MGIRPHTLALDAARRVPTALVPCPECGVVVGAGNLARHLDEVHGAADTAHEVSELRGVDGAIVGPLALAGVNAFVVSFALGGLLNQTRLFLGIGAGFLGLALVLVGVAWSGAIRARVGLTADAVELRYAFGFLTRRVRLASATIEAGAWIAHRAPAGSSDANVPHDEVRAGAYVRVSDGNAAITFAHRGASLRKRWSTKGVRSGAKRLRFDVRLETRDLVAVEHALHALGVLHLREGHAPRDGANDPPPT